MHPNHMNYSFRLLFAFVLDWSYRYPVLLHRFYKLVYLTVNVRKGGTTSGRSERCQAFFVDQAAVKRKIKDSHKRQAIGKLGIWVDSHMLLLLLKSIFCLQTGISSKLRRSYE